MTAAASTPPLDGRPSLLAPPAVETAEERYPLPGVLLAPPAAKPCPPRALEAHLIGEDHLERGCAARPMCLPRSAELSGLSLGLVTIVDLPACLARPPAFTAGPSVAASGRHSHSRLPAFKSLVCLPLMEDLVVLHAGLPSATASPTRGSARESRGASASASLANAGPRTDSSENARPSLGDSSQSLRMCQLA